MGGRVGQRPGAVAGPRQHAAIGADQNALGVATGFGALSLFINFVNLFQFLLAFMGGNRN